MTYPRIVLAMVMTLAVGMLHAEAEADSQSGRGPRVPKVALKPTARAARRAEELKAGIRSFRLVFYYVGMQDKPYYALTLTVGELQERRDWPFHPAHRISESQAARIIDNLALEGFLDRARDSSKRPPRAPGPLGPAYLLTVSASPQAGGVEFTEDLGWSLAMLRRLEGFKAAMSGEAAMSMNTLIERLSGHRRLWKEEGASDNAKKEDLE